MTGLKRRRNIMVARTETGLHATGHYASTWHGHSAWGGKIEGDCITCPLHQSKYDICSGDVKDWSPFPLLPMCWKMLAKMRKERPLEIHEVRDSEGCRRGLFNAKSFFQRTSQYQVKHHPTGINKTPKNTDKKSVCMHIHVEAPLPHPPRHHYVTCDKMSPCRRGPSACS